ncbi:hypothetical protein Tco_1222839 [Tanacetum coccineum]
MNNKKHIINLEYFREMLQICPIIRNQKFDEPPFEQEILTFLISLGHNGEIRKITNVNVNKLHQPWRSFAVGMYHKNNVDYAFLLWEDFTYQVENKNTKKGNVMYYPRFTKLIVNFFMLKDPSIPLRNKINWHYARDDPMFITINVISGHEDTQLYSAILPKELTNKDIRNSKSYKEYYAIALGEVPPKTKASVHKKKADSDTTTKKKPSTDPKDKSVKQTGKMNGSGKQKQPATGLETLSEIALTKTKQLKIATKRSQIQTLNSQASGSGDGVDILSKVPDEQVHEKTGIDEGAGDKPEVPDVPEHHSDSEEDSWTFSDGDDDDEDDDAKKDSDAHDDNDVTESDDDDYQPPDESEKQKDDDRVKDGEQDKEGTKTNVNLEGGDVDMTETDTTKDTKDVHVTLMAVTPIKFIKDQVKTQTSKIKSKVEKYVTEYLGAEVLIRSTNQPQTTYEIASSLSELELKRILMDKMEENKSIYNALVKAYNMNKDLLSSYGDVIILPRTSNDKDKDEEPSVGSNQGTKRRRSCKEVESSKEPTHKENRTTSYSKGASRSQPTDLNETTHLEFIIGDDDVIPAREAQDERQWHPPTSPTPDRECLSKPLPLIPNAQGHLVIPFNHFINNDREYLKGGSSSRKYTTSITKTKAADYGQVKWIEERIPKTTWSVDVYSRHRIIAVISLKNMKFFGYSHLEEITVHRQDDVLYKF